MYSPVLHTNLLFFFLLLKLPDIKVSLWAGFLCPFKMSWNYRLKCPDIWRQDLWEDNYYYIKIYGNINGFMKREENSSFPHPVPGKGG